MEIEIKLTEKEYYILNVILGHLIPNDETSSILDKFNMELDCEDYAKLKFEMDSDGFMTFEFQEEEE
jgi:hypothetical protein